MPTALACPVCRTGMLARRGDPLCPTCAKAAQEMAPQPLWVFDSLLLREALAQVNLAAVPAIVRAACGLSQRELAGIVGWNPATLSYYERGHRDGMFDIRTVLQFADAVGMPRAALLPLVFADTFAGLAIGTEDGTSMKPLTSRGCGALPPSLPAVSMLRGVTPSHLHYWQACVDVLYARDRSVGGTFLLPLAVQQWRRARAATGDGSSGETGCQLHAVAAELALCTGWIALGGGQLPMAKLLYEEARELATVSGDVVLRVHVLTNQSMLYAEMARRGSARHALRLAFRAQHECRCLPMPRLHALIALRHASAASLIGDKAAFQGAIIQARRELDSGPQGDPPEWLRFVDHAEIAGVEAHGWLNLGDPIRSAQLYRQVLESVLSPRNRASHGAGLADALLNQGARQGAITAAMDVVLALEDGVTSMRCLDQLRHVRQAAASTPGAEEFRARFDAIQRHLATSRIDLGDGIADAEPDVSSQPTWEGDSTAQEAGARS